MQNGEPSLLLVMFLLVCLQIMRRPKWFVDNDFRVKDDFTGRQRTAAFLEEPNELCDSDVACDDDHDSNASYDMLLDEDDEEFCIDDYLDCSNERDALRMVVEGDSGKGVEGEGGGTSVDQVDGHSQNLPPRAKATLIQALQLRLEHLITNIADYPPAQIFVK